MTSQEEVALAISLGFQSVIDRRRGEFWYWFHKNDWRVWESARADRTGEPPVWRVAFIGAAGYSGITEFGTLEEAMRFASSQKSPNRA